MECKLCAKRFLCKNNGQPCKDYEKEPYTIVVKEGGIKRIERIEKNENRYI